MLSEPIMNFYGKFKIGHKKLGASIRALLTMLTLLLIAVTILFLLIPPIIKQAGNLSQVNLDAIGTTLRQPLQQIVDFFNNHGFPLTIDSIMTQIQNSVRSNFKFTDIAGILGSIVTFAGNFVFAFASIMFITFFFIKDEGMFLNAIIALVPVDRENHFKNILADIQKLLTRYFGALLIQMILFASCNLILLWIMGVKNALLIAVIGGLLNVIPYVGPIIGMSLGLFITLSANVNVDFYNVLLPLFYKVIGAFLITQQVDGFIIQPNVFGNSINAHPLEIFLVILVGAKIGGITGMVLAIPCYTVLRVIARVFFNEFKVVQQLTKKIEDI